MDSQSTLDQQNPPEKLTLNQQARFKEIRPLSRAGKSVKYAIIAVIGLLVFLLTVLILGFIWGGVVYGARLNASGLPVSYAIIYLLATALAGVFVVLLSGRNPLFSLFGAGALIVLSAFMLDGSSDIDWLSVLCKTAVTFVALFITGLYAYKRLHPPRKSAIPRN